MENLCESCQNLGTGKCGRCSNYDHYQDRLTIGFVIIVLGMIFMVGMVITFLKMFF